MIFKIATTGNVSLRVETPVAVAGGRIYATTVNGNIDSLGLAQ